MRRKGVGRWLDSVLNKNKSDFVVPHDIGIIDHRTIGSDEKMPKNLPVNFNKNDGGFEDTPSLSSYVPGCQQ